MIASGDDYATFLFEQYNGQVMPKFERLSYNDIRSILTFIEHASLSDVRRTSSAGRNLSLNALRGKVIFRDQCRSCHLVHREAYGPALGSVTKRRPDEWLRQFVRNSSNVIRSGDVYANFLFRSYDNREMVPMPFLPDRDIEDVFAYIREEVETDNVLFDSIRLSEQSRVYIKPSSRDAKQITKYVFIAISILVASLFGYLTVRLFRYLQNV